MKGRTARRVGFAAGALALALGGALLAGTVAAPAPAAAPNAVRSETGGTLDMKFKLNRFQVVGRGRAKRLVAHGTVVATYREGGVVRATQVQAIMLRAQQGATCQVLHLELGTLHLELLGLIVDLTAVDSDKIVLDISAKSDEALGKLLCQLISAVQGGKTAKTTKATRRLNAAFARHNVGALMNVSVPLGQRRLAQVSAGPCKVLDLVLGPLYVDLLGLVIQLNKVELQLTAEPVGTLGVLFCQLAGGPSPTTTSSTTTGTTATTTTATTTTTTATTATTAG